MILKLSIHMYMYFILFENNHQTCKLLVIYTLVLYLTSQVLELFFSEMLKNQIQVFFSHFKNYYIILICEKSIEQILYMCERYIIFNYLII